MRETIKQKGEAPSCFQRPLFLFIVYFNAYDQEENNLYFFLRGIRMIKYLDNTIETLLTHVSHGVKKELCGNVTVSFDPPDASFPPSSLTLPAINLFLHELRERKELRGAGENARQTERNGKIYQTLHPVWLDCSYLITAWAADIFSEHMILGEVARVLARNETFPKEVLHEAFLGADPEAIIFESRILPIQTSNVQNVMGEKFKAAIHCMITMGISLKEETDMGAPIKERRFRMDGSDNLSAQQVGDDAEELVFLKKNRLPES